MATVRGSVHRFVSQHDSNLENGRAQYYTNRSGTPLLIRTLLAVLVYHSVIHLANRKCAPFVLRQPKIALEIWSEACFCSPGAMWV